MKNNNHLFTSESVTIGHPDKMADQISDAILDAALKDDPNSRVACETLVTTGLTVVAGEITTQSNIDFQKVVRNTIKKIGYTDPHLGFDYENCAVVISLDKQSPDISQGVSEGQGQYAAQGAGDQGLMFGFACSDTPSYMPMPIHLAHLLTDNLRIAREEGVIGWLKPDGKSQVTVEYDENGKPSRIHTVVISTQHEDKISQEEIEEEIYNNVIIPVLPKKLIDDNIIIHINPTGRFVTGGPRGDCGLTGRKIIVDTYGGMGRHGGGAFSGKDPSKVDRSASYLARHIAKNIVAAGIASICEVQLAYSIGIAEPVSVLVDTAGTSTINEKTIEKMIRDKFPLTPKEFIDYLDLKRPIYEKTAENGHFGKDDTTFTWEKINLDKQ
jgi:S-adenosylmethionine synthetase